MKIIQIVHNRIKSRNIFGNNLKVGIFQANSKLFTKNGINLCYNKYIPSQYDPSKKNILLALESPAVIEDRKWLSPEMKFHAEISFYNYYQLDNYLCCRELYVNNDNFINLKLGTLFKNKSGKVSIVCSDKKALDGHKFRHQIVNQLNKELDIFGSGYHKFGDITTAFTDYKFQIVIENGKYPEYVSEKLFDCIKTQTIPIYWGGDEGLKKMGFDIDGFIFFNNIEELERIVKKIDDKLYLEKYDALLFNLSRLIELRNENKLKLYLNAIMFGYMQTTSSYLGYEFNKLNLELDNI